LTYFNVNLPNVGGEFGSYLGHGGGHTGDGTRTARSEAEMLPVDKATTVEFVRLALLAVVMGIAAGLFARGSLRNLINARFRNVVLLGIYAAGMIAARFELRWSFAMMLVGMLAFVAFAFRNALPVPGMAVVGFGLLLNLAVTANNGGMPYRPSAVVSAGAVSSKSADLVPKDGVMQHAERPSDQLMILADVIPLRPLREVVSIGDVLVALGLGLIAFSAVAGSLSGAHSSSTLSANQPTALVRLNAIGVDPSVPRTPSRGVADIEGDWLAWEHKNSKNGNVIDLTEARHAVEAEAQKAKLDEWDHRIQLLKATGDITVVLDLVSAEDRQRIDDSDSDDEHSATARLAVERALQSSESRAVS
jgi:Family of unknown function (DUF5317)